MATGSTMSLNGRVEKTDIPTLLRSIEKDKNSGELSFTRGSERIELYFLFGQLYHAKWGQTDGVDAVAELLTWRNGNYSFTEGIIPAQATINDDLEQILNERLGANSPVQAVDTSRRAMPAPPPAPAPVRNAPPAPPAAPARPFQSGVFGRPASNDWSASPAPANRPQTGPLGNPATNSRSMPSAGGGSFSDPNMSELVPFDLASLDSMNAVFPTESFTPPPATPGASAMMSIPGGRAAEELDPAVAGGKVAPAPPAGGLYRTRLFCLPTGEQMATSLVATGPQLEEELLHLAEVKFTGYVLGGPEISGFPSVGVCLMRGRFIHAFYHQAGPNGMTLLEGERAYRTALDQSGSGAARFYWFYELSTEIMRAAIALLTPPTRYSHLEMRILRFREVLRLLNEESFTGTLRITVPPGAQSAEYTGATYGERAYIPIFQGQILGLWSESAPRLTNDGQLLQRFVNDPQAYLDLHSTAPVSDPGIPLESLISVSNAPFSTEIFNQELGTLRRDVTPTGQRTGTTTPLDPQQPARQLPSPDYSEPSIPETALVVADDQSDQLPDDERQMLLISSISRMESTWTQMQKKGATNTQSILMTLNGFANEVLSLIESVTGRRGVQDMLQRALRNELVQYRDIFQMLNVQNGRLNVVSLLREYELVSRQGGDNAEEFGRDANRALRTLLRSSFQYYVSLIRSENTRFESHDMYEVFLQEVVRKM
jgi:Domain of unknown function (DUF4388)